MNDPTPVNGTPINDEAEETLRKVRHLLGQLDEKFKRMRQLHDVTKLDDSGHITRSMLRTEMKRMDANVGGLHKDVQIAMQAISQLEQAHNAMSNTVATLMGKVEAMEKAYLLMHTQKFGSGPTA